MANSQLTVGTVRKNPLSSKLQLLSDEALLQDIGHVFFARLDRVSIELCVVFCLFEHCACMLNACNNWK